MNFKTIQKILEQKNISPWLLSSIEEDPRKNVQEALQKRAKRMAKEQEERFRLMQLYELEQEGLEFGLSVGIDEAGRGPLAGPVYAAAVILPLGIYIKGLRDSKKIKHEERAELRAQIEDKALSIGWGYASVEEIDTMNILQATYLAMNRAYKKLSIRGEYVLVDGNGNPGIENVIIKPVVGGDDLSASIAAASIIAKERRDEVMMLAHELYPEYGFDKHKGYGTKDHYKALDRFGPSLVHRMSFLRKWSFHE
jgi:ribonuclease HII